MSLQHQELSRLLTIISELGKDYPDRYIFIQLIKDNTESGNLYSAIHFANKVIETQIAILQTPSSIISLIESL